MQDPNNKCEIISYLVKYAGFSNRLISFVYPNLRPTQCSLRKDLVTKIETRCRTSLETVVYILTGSIFPAGFNLKTLPIITFSPVKLSNETMDLLDAHKFIIFSIPSKGNFPGHIFAVIKINQDKYYLLQSYVFVYKLELNIATRSGIFNLFKHYFITFNGSNNIWLNEDVILWKGVTGVDTKTLLGIQRPRYINVYSIQHPFEIYNNDCSQFLRQLLQSASEKLSSIETSDRDLIEVFGDLRESDGSLQDLRGNVFAQIQIAIDELISSRVPEMRIRTITLEGFLGNYIIAQPYSQLPSS